MEHIEEILSNTQPTNSDADVKETMNDIINGMKQMLRMIRVSLQNSTPSNVLSSIEPFIQSAVHKAYSEDLRNKEKRIEALQKIIMNNQTKLEDAELYSKHLENRISSLEECNSQHVDRRISQLEDCNKQLIHRIQSLNEGLDVMFEEITHTQAQVTELRDQFDNASMDSDSASVDSSVDNRVDPTPDESQSDMVQDIIHPPPPPPIEVPDLNNADIEAKLDQIMKSQQADQDNKVRRQVLFSNIYLPQMSDRYINDRMNFWPYLRSQLQVLGLEFILSNAENVKKLKSGALLITYKRNYQANNTINRLRHLIGHMKSSQRNYEGEYVNPWGHVLSEEMIEQYLKIKFTRLIPNRYNGKRKILQKLANHLKDNRKIIWFDLHVIGSTVYLKTKWRKQLILGGHIYYVKKFTHYTVDQARAILDGITDIDEDRESRDRSQEQVRDVET